MSTKINIVIDQAASFYMESDLTDRASNGPLDITGYSAQAQLRKSYQSNTAVDFTTTLTTGVVSIALAANTTALIEAGRYVYDIRLISSNNVVRVIEGLATVTPATSRS